MRAGVSEITVEKVDLGDCKVRLDVTVPKSVAGAARQECLEGFAESVRFPAFVQEGRRRKKADGKLPPADVIINFVGATEFKQSCVEEMLQRSIPRAMEVVAATALQDSGASTPPSRRCEALRQRARRAKRRRDMLHHLRGGAHDRVDRGLPQAHGHGHRARRRRVRRDGG